MNGNMKSQQQHTIPRWLLENFTDRDGMLHVARNHPRTLFKGRPKNVFRRRDYYAAKVIGVSLEDKVTQTENLFIPYVKNVLDAARKGIDDVDLSCMEAVMEDVRACGLLLLHLSYRSPQWLGENFFSGLDAMRVEAERIGMNMDAVIGQESSRILQAGEFVIVFSQVDAPTFVVGDCGAFVSRDIELGVDNEKRKRNDPNWVPAEQRIWMALSPEVALGVAIREAPAGLCVDLIPDSKSSADWVDHFNEICARHSTMIAGASEKWVRAASQKAWSTD